MFEEAKLLEQLQKTGRCRHVVHMFRSVEVAAELKLYMLLEYAECDMADTHINLNSLRGSSSPSPCRGMPFLEAHECWRQMVTAVAEIHRQKVIHSDVKPANFLLIRGKVKLSDFGLARRINADQTHVTRNGQVGTVRYMAPESIFQPANVCDEDEEERQDYKVNGGGSPTSHGHRAAFGKNEKVEVRGGLQVAGNDDRAPADHDVEAEGEGADDEEGPVVRTDTDVYSALHLKPSADVWSLGIILYSLLYLETPFQKLEAKLDSVRLMFVISDPRVEILYPALEPFVEKTGRCVAYDSRPVAGAEVAEADPDPEDFPGCVEGADETLVGRGAAEADEVVLARSSSGPPPTAFRGHQEQEEEAGVATTHDDPRADHDHDPDVNDVFRSMVAVMQQCLHRDPGSRWNCEEILDAWTHRIVGRNTAQATPGVNTGTKQPPIQPDPEPAGCRFLRNVIQSKRDDVGLVGVEALQVVPRLRLEEIGIGLEEVDGEAAEDLSANKTIPMSSTLGDEAALKTAALVRSSCSSSATAILPSRGDDEAVQVLSQLSNNYTCCTGEEQEAEAAKTAVVGDPSPPRGLVKDDDGGVDEVDDREDDDLPEEKLLSRSSCTLLCGLPVAVVLPLAALLLVAPVSNCSSGEENAPRSARLWVLCKKNPANIEKQGQQAPDAHAGAAARRFAAGGRAGQNARSGLQKKSKKIRATMIAGTPPRGPHRKNMHLDHEQELLQQRLSDRRMKIKMQKIRPALKRAFWLDATTQETASMLAQPWVFWRWDRNVSPKRHHTSGLNYKTRLAGRVRTNWQDWLYVGRLQYRHKDDHADPSFVQKMVAPGFTSLLPSSVLKLTGGWSHTVLYSPWLLWFLRAKPVLGGKGARKLQRLGIESWEEWLEHDYLSWCGRGKLLCCCRPVEGR
eukprot:g6247.t1